jgi:hypothetical protein
MSEVVPQDSKSDERNRTPMATKLYLCVAFLLCTVASFAQATWASSSQALSTASPQKPESAAQKPSLDKGSYRVIVDSVQKKANNYTVTLIFENLTDRAIKIKWLHSSFLRGPGKEEPYLLDERSNKYVLQAERFQGILGDEVYGGAQVLAGTNLKLRYLFFGSGSGETFELLANDLSDKTNGRPVILKGLKITSNEDLKPTAGLPTFVTESYRVVVESIRRDASNLTMTLVFESLADRTFTINWGDGRYNDNGIWESSEPYLIDENADRYYLRGQDTGKIIGFLHWDQQAELLPKTKLKTHLVFKVTESGSSFTFACKERSPKKDRPIVIQGLKVSTE